jgi:hypothetical protein
MKQVRDEKKSGRRLEKGECQLEEQIQQQPRLSKELALQASQ